MIKRLIVICSDESTLKNMKELRMNYIKRNFPINNLLNRLFLKNPKRPKLSLAHQKVVS